MGAFDDIPATGGGAFDDIEDSLGAFADLPSDGKAPAPLRKLPEMRAGEPSMADRAKEFVRENLGLKAGWERDRADALNQVSAERSAQRDYVAGDKDAHPARYLQSIRPNTVAGDTLTSVAGVPLHAAAAGIQAVRGGDVDVHGGGLGDSIVQASREKAERDFNPVNPTASGLGPSLGFSAANMGAGLAAGLGTGVAVGMTPAAPAAPYAGWVAGSGASFATAYRAARDSFVLDLRDMLNEQSRKDKGRSLTAEEWDLAKTKYEEQADKYGLWEAVPETVGNLIGAGLLSAPAKSVFAKMFTDKALSRPAVQKFMKLAGTETGDLTAKMAGMQLSEHPTETLTGWGQGGIEAEVGLRKEAPTLVEAFEEQAPMTTAQTLLIGATGIASKGAYDRWKHDVPDSIKRSADTKQEPDTTDTPPVTAAEVHKAATLREIAKVESALEQEADEAKINAMEARLAELYGELEAGPAQQAAPAAEQTQDATPKAPAKLPYQSGKTAYGLQAKARAAEGLEVTPADLPAADLDAAGTSLGAAPEVDGIHYEPGLAPAPDLGIEQPAQARRIARDEAIAANERALGDVTLPDGLSDARMKRLPYRQGLESLARDLVKDGGIAVIPDPNAAKGADGQPIANSSGITTPSINPAWFQTMNATPETAMSVQDVQAAVKKALAGEKLGVRQARVVGAMLDTITGERAENVDAAREQLEAARKTARDGFGYAVPNAAENLPESDYSPEWDANQRIIRELMQEAGEIDPGAAEATAERLAIQGASDQQIMEALDAIITGVTHEAGQTEQARAEPAGAGRAGEVQGTEGRRQAEPTQEPAAAEEVAQRDDSAGKSGYTDPVKAENERLKAEIARLRSQNEQARSESPAAQGADAADADGQRDSERGAGQGETGVRSGYEGGDDLNLRQGQEPSAVARPEQAPVDRRDENRTPPATATEVWREAVSRQYDEDAKENGALQSLPVDKRREIARAAISITLRKKPLPIDPTSGLAHGKEVIYPERTEDGTIYGLFLEGVLNAAIQHVKNGGAATVSEADYGNLGGINHYAGQAGGDKAIADISGIVRKTTQGEAVDLVRYGGDELFAIGRDTNVAAVLGRADDQLQEYMRNTTPRMLNPRLEQDIAGNKEMNQAEKDDALRHMDTPLADLPAKPKKDETTGKLTFYPGGTRLHIGTAVKVEADSTAEDLYRRADAALAPVKNRNKAKAPPLKQPATAQQTPAAAGVSVSGDITTSTGQPFKSRKAAEFAAKARKDLKGRGYVPVQQGDGWVLRKPENPIPPEASAAGTLKSQPGAPGAPVDAQAAAESFIPTHELPDGTQVRPYTEDGETQPNTWEDADGAIIEDDNAQPIETDAARDVGAGASVKKQAFAEFKERSNGSILVKGNPDALADYIEPFAGKVKKVPGGVVLTKAKARNRRYIPVTRETLQSGAVVDTFEDGGAMLSYNGYRSGIARDRADLERIYASEVGPDKFREAFGNDADPDAVKEYDKEQERIAERKAANKRADEEKARQERRAEEGVKRENEERAKAAEQFEKERQRQWEETIGAGKADNPLYQAFLDTVEEPGKLRGNAEYINWIGVRNEEFEKENGQRPMMSRSLEADKWSAKQLDYVRKYADANLSDRVKAQRAKPDDAAAASAAEGKAAGVDEKKAAAILTRANVTGKERLDIMRDFREGKHALADLEAAYPAKADESASESISPAETDKSVSVSQTAETETQQVAPKETEQGVALFSRRRAAAPVETATVSSYGVEFETGKPVTFAFLHNKESATKLFGKPKKDSGFGRFHEPSGRYVIDVREPKTPDFGVFDTGYITFQNPLVIENDSLQWKKKLSDAYGGLRGKKLSLALIADGYDGVVTVDNGHTSEILDLTTFDENKALFSRQPRFYSQLQRAIESAPDKVFGKAAQVKLWLQSNSAKLGIKKDELQWSGILDYLDMRKGEKVSKEEVVAFLSENGVQVRDVVLGNAGIGGEEKITADDVRSILSEPYEDIAYFAENNGIDDLADAARRASEAWIESESSGNEFDASYDEEIRDASDAAIKSLTESPPTKFSEYTPPGGIEGSYREILVTLPTKPLEGEPLPLPSDWKTVSRTDSGLFGDGPERIVWDVVDGAGRIVVSGHESEGAALSAANNTRPERARHDVARNPNFRSSHFDEPNILVHLRTDEVTGADGKRYLRVIEVQSDWGQEGKKKGFVEKKPKQERLNDLTQAMYGVDFANATAEQQRWAENMEPHHKDGGTMAAPFVTDTRAWVALGIKRAIMHAVNSGVDGVVFATGQQNADLYDLSKRLQSLSYMKVGDKYRVTANKLDNGGTVDFGTSTEAELEDKVGKEVAEKIVNGEGVKSGDMTILRGLDLKGGGEGMRTFYDQIVPSVANEVLKKIGGGKVEPISIKDGSPGRAPAGETRYRVMADGREWNATTTLETAEAEAEEARSRGKKNVEVIDTATNETAQPGFPIADAMREQVQTVGLPLFARRLMPAGMPRAHDFIVPDTPEFDGNETGDLAYVPAAAEQKGVPALPIRVTAGEIRGRHRGFGVNHVAAEAEIDVLREAPQFTADRAENFARQIAAVARSFDEVYKEAGDRFVLRSRAMKQALVVQERTDENGEQYLSVVTLTPADKPVWGNPVWTGRSTPTSDRLRQPGAPDGRSIEQGRDTGVKPIGVQTEPFKLSPAKGKTQPAISVKKRRVFRAKDDPAFSRGFAVAGDTMAATDVQSIMDAVTASLPGSPKVGIIATMDDAPADVRAYDEQQRSEGASGAVEGFYHVKSGRVYLVLDGIAQRPGETAQQAIIRTWAHEVLGHAGLRGAFGKQLLPILKEVALRRRADVKKKAEQYGLDFKNEGDRLTAAEEVLAEMAETMPENSLVTRAIEAIRKALRALYLRLPKAAKDAIGGKEFVRWINSMTDAEMIERFILPARRFIERGKAQEAEVAPVAAMSRGADDVTLSGMNDKPGSGDNLTESQPLEPENDAQAAAREILDVMSADTLADYGLRVIGEDYDVTDYKIGDKLEPSYRWDSGTTTDEELSGTSTAAISESDDIDSVMRAIRNLGAHGENGPNGYYHGKTILLLKGDSAGWGEDVGERLLKNAEVVGIWKKKDSGKSTILPNGSPNQSQRTQGAGETRFSRQQPAMPGPERGGQGASGRKTGNSLRQKSTAPPVSEFHSLNERLRERDRTLWVRAKQSLRRQLSPGGLLPRSVFKDKITRDSQMNAIEFDVRHHVGRLERAVMSEYGGKFAELQPGVVAMISDALAGDVSLELKEKTREAIYAMRQYIDGLSSKYAEMLKGEASRLLTSTGIDRDHVEPIISIYLEELADGTQESAEDAVLIIMRDVAGDDVAAVDALRKAISSGSLATAAKSQLIRSNIGEYVHRSYQAFDDPKWFAKLDDATINAARDYFVSRYNESGDSLTEAKRKAEIAIHEIVKNGTAYDSVGAFIKEGKLGAKDLSIMMRRKQIAPEIRALLGEYKDARLNYAKSATKMGRLIWNQRFLDSVREQGMGVFLFEGDKRPPEATKQIAGDSSETYAPLNGLWTFPDVEQSFRDALGKEQIGWFYGKVIQLNGMVKFGKTVLSPTTAARNWQSAMFFALANGHFDMRHIAKSVSGLREYFTQQGEGAQLKYLRELQELGVIYDNPYAGEMMRLLAETKIEDALLRGKDPLKFRDAIDIAQKFYQYGDDFWKIVGFENEKALLMKHAGLTEAKAKVEAAERIRNTYPTYSMTGRAVNWLRRFPLVGTFVSFPAEIIRTTGNMLRYIHADMQNPKTRPLAMRRIAGFAVAAGAAQALQALTAALFDVDDDDEEAVRDLSATWSQNSNFIYLGRDEDGLLRYIDTSFLDPYNYFKRPVIAMLRDQPWEEKAATAIGEMLKPFLGTDIAAGAIMEIMANKTETGRAVYREGGMPADQLNDITNHLRKALQPGIVSNLERTYKALNGEVSRSGRRYDLKDEAAGWLGWRATTLDPKVALYYRGFDFNDKLSEASAAFNRVITDPNEVSVDEMVEALRRTNKMRERAFVRMGRVISAAMASGMTKQEVDKTLRTNGISKETSRALIFGKIPSWEPSGQSIESAKRKAVLLYGRDKAIEFGKRYRDAVKAYRELEIKK